MRYLIFLWVSALMVMNTCTSQAEQSDNTMYGTIVELGLEDRVLQVDDYILKIPDEFKKCSSTKDGTADETISGSDLKVGQVTRFEVKDKINAYTLAVENFTVLTGECIQEYRDKLEEESLSSSAEQYSDSFLKENQSVDIDTSTDSSSGSQNLHMENGVWKN